MFEKRKYPRVDYREAVKYSRIRHREVGGCLSYDLSEGGIRLRSDDFVPLGAEMSLEFRVRKEGSLTKAGRVVWVQRVPYAENYQVGVRFDQQETNPKNQEALAEFVQIRMP